ncbi:DUF4123 domain-containing protein [Stenotrophomonas maltophilia]|uniref:DUF4123 domain-containing protein n=1 Tax=Stenotrophomonas maltophilia TaxID=40324 RepID=UPI0028953F08|nr:DUF4123 domain-containing protein [Stenotrophomonas maltophilia]MDT3499599.1 DUF4123 domain-containing protein [Stenotrophomonas maltophilia]
MQGLFVLVRQGQIMDHRNFLRQDYGLINPLQLDPGQWQEMPSIPLIPAQLDAAAHQMPHLIILRDMPEMEKLRMLDKSDSWQGAYGVPIIPVLLRSSEKPDVLAKKLMASMLARYRRDGWFWLRFHDPRVFRHLQWIMNPAQLQRLMGRGNSWSWFDQEHKGWCEKECPESGAEYPLVLDMAQWGSVFRLEVLNRTLKDVLRIRPGLEMSERLFRDIDELILRAVEVEALTALDDQVAYTRNSLIFGPAFHEHPAIRACLASARIGEAGYTSGVALVERDVLSEINFEMGTAQIGQA